jgi:hypothetical protein
MAGNKKAALGAAIGALDPVLKNWARNLAKNVPNNSPLRSELFGVAQGVVKGLVEVLAGKLPPTASIVVEKITDFSDFFAGALGSASEKEKKAVVEDWMDQFFNDAKWRLKKSRDPKAEAEKMKVEFECRLALLKLIEDARPKPPEPTDSVDEPIDWQKKWKSFIKGFHGFSDGLIEFGREFDKEFQISNGIKKTDQAVAQKLGDFIKALAERGIR